MGREFDPRRIRPDEIRLTIETLRTLSGLPHFDSETTGRVLGDLHIALQQAKDRGLPSSGGSLKERWRRWREQRRESRQNEELAHLLTKEASIVSGTGWQIYHPLREEQVSYVRKPNGYSQVVTDIMLREEVYYGERKGLKEYIGPEYIRIGDMNTCIIATAENNSSGSNAVRLAIFSDRRENSRQPNVYLYATFLEYYISRPDDNHQGGVETGIVVFENSSKNERHYFQLQPSHSTSAVGLVEMERVAA